MSKLQTKTIKEYEANGWYVINLIKTNKNGIPDLLCLKENCKPLFIEIKEQGYHWHSIRNLKIYRGLYPLLRGHGVPRVKHYPLFHPKPPLSRNNRISPPIPS